MTDVTKAELAALQDLESVALQCMRSKPILRILTKMEDKGLIRLNPFEGTAELTDAGRAAMAPT